jgi:hypothetical protein
VYRQLKPRNRQRIANARTTPTEVNNRQALNGAEGLFPGRGSLQSVYPPPQRQDFALSAATTKRIYDRPNNAPDKLSHPASIARLSIDCQLD